MKNYTTILFWLFIWLIFQPLIGFSQSFPIQIQALAPQPTPVSLPQLLGQTGTPLLVVVNTSAKEKSIMLSANLSSNIGINGNIDPLKKKPALPIVIPGFGSQIITGDDLIQIFANYSIFDVNYKGISPKELAKNPLFPEGTYIVCATAFDYKTGKQLSQDPPLGCTPPITIITPDPPSIKSPIDGEELVKTLFDNTLFSWTPVTSKFTPFYYNLRIVTVPFGVNPYDAMDNFNLIWWEEDGIVSNNYLHNPSIKPFNTNTTYAVQITAYDPLGYAYVKNDGKSKIHTFSITRPEIPAPSIIHPLNNTSIEMSSNKEIIKWNAVTNPEFPVFYKVQIGNLEGKHSKYEVWNYPESIVIDQEFYESTSFSWNLSNIDKSKEYAIRVQAFNNTDPMNISNNGWSEINQFRFEEKLPQPAQFISPSNGEELTQIFPAKIQFKWNELQIKDVKNTRYELRIFDQKDLENPIFIQTEISDLKFDYSDSNTLLNNHSYVAKLKTYDLSGDIQFDNNGDSEYITFLLKESPSYPRPFVSFPEQNSINESYLPLELDLKWTHDIPKNTGTKYKIFLWENIDNLSPEEIVASNDPVYSIENIEPNYFNDFPENIDLEEHQQYLLEIIAYHSNDEVYYEHEGKSPIVIFEMKRKIHTQNLDLSCGNSCNKQMTTNKIGSPNFSSGDELIIGDFIIVLGNSISYNPTSASYNGSAVIKSSSFFNAPIKVDISGVKANQEQEIFEGEIIAQINNQVQWPSSWNDINVNSTTPSNIQNVIEHLESYSISNNYQSVNSIKLPIVFNGVYISHLQINAVADGISSYSTYGYGSNNQGRIEVNANLISYKEIQPGNYWFFGKQTCFTSSGPAMTVEGSPNPLWLLEEKTINESNTYTLNLKTVTKQTYDCNGLLPEVFVSGTINYKHTGLATIDNYTTTPLNTKPLKGVFTATFEEWEDWSTSIYFVDDSNLLTHINLVNDDLDGFEFRFSHGILDHSIQRNPVGFSSASNNQTGAHWKGVFLNKSKVSLPHFIDIGNSSGIVGARHQVPLKNLYLDGLGLNGNCQFTTPTNQSSNLLLGDWEYNLNKIDISIVENKLEEIYIEGEVYVPFFESKINLDLELQNTYTFSGIRRQNWFASSDLSNHNVDIPVWDSSAELNEDTRINMELTNDKMDILLSFDFGGSFDFKSSIGTVNHNNLKNLNFRNLEMYNHKFWNGVSYPLLKAASASFGVRASEFDKVGGYAVNIQQVTIKDLGSSPNTKLNSLKFDYDFGLDDLISGLSVDGSLEVIARPIGQRITSFEQTVTKIADIELKNTSIPGGEVSGFLHWEDSNNSEHFEGQLYGNIMNFSGTIHGYCGNVDSYGYWSLALDYKSHQAPIVIIPALLSATEFSGGVYCNMDKIVPEPGASATDVTFVAPQSAGEIDNFGINIGTLMFTGDGKEFSGRFLLGVEIDTDEDALDHINLSGVGHLLDDNLSLNYWLSNSGLSESAQLKIFGDIEYSYTQGRLFGSFGYDLNYQNGKFTGSGEDVVNFNFGGPKWHIHVGSMDNLMNVDLNYFDDPIACTGYMMVGGEFGGNVGEAFGGIQFGLNGSFTTISDPIWFPLSLNDKIRAGCDINVNLEGGAGYGLDYCSNHSPSDFFAYLGINASASAYVEYWEDEDSYFYYFKKQEEYVPWFSTNVSIGGNLYINKPTGMNGYLSISGASSWPFYESWSASPSFQLGENCQ